MCPPFGQNTYSSLQINVLNNEVRNHFLCMWRELYLTIFTVSGPLFINICCTGQTFQNEICLSSSPTIYWFEATIVVKKKVNPGACYWKLVHLHVLLKVVKSFKSTEIPTFWFPLMLTAPPLFLMYKSNIIPTAPCRWDFFLNVCLRERDSPTGSLSLHYHLILPSRLVYITKSKPTRILYRIL
jgi:hypothetical protein